jgi:hypothetical protein
MRLLLIFVVLFIFCASFGPHTSVYVDTKKELDRVTNDLQKNNIKYKIIRYDVGIYEVQYKESKK